MIHIYICPSKSGVDLDLARTRTIHARPVVSVMRGISPTIYSNIKLLSIGYLSDQSIAGITANWNNFVFIFYSDDVKHTGAPHKHNKPKWLIVVIFTIA